MAVEKDQNPGGRFGATSKTALPIWPIYQEIGQNGLNWQDFYFFNCHGCQTLIFYEILCYLSPPTS